MALQPIIIGRNLMHLFTLYFTSCCSSVACSCSPNTKIPRSHLYSGAPRARFKSASVKKNGPPVICLAAVVSFLATGGDSRSEADAPQAGSPHRSGFGPRESAFIQVRVVAYVVAIESKFHALVCCFTVFPLSSLFMSV